MMEPIRKTTFFAPGAPIGAWGDSGAFLGKDSPQNPCDRRCELHPES